MRPLFAFAVALALVPPVVIQAPPAPEPVVQAAATEDLPAIAYAVAECESGGDYQAENPISTASGAYQFVNATWTWVTDLPPPASSYSENIQDAAFLELWNDGEGWQHWSETYDCWKDAR